MPFLLRQNNIGAGCARGGVVMFVFRALALVSLLALGGGCGRRPAPVTVAPLPHFAGEVASDGATLLLRSQRGAPIEWKAATPPVFTFAKQQRALVLMVLGSHMQSSTDQVLRILHDDAGLVQWVKRHYVPVLVDVDQQREYGLMAMDLATRSSKTLNFPVVAWMTGDGNPVTWLVFSPQDDPTKMRQDLRNSMDLIDRMWGDNPEYIEKNSQQDTQKWADSARRYNEFHATCGDDRRATSGTAIKTLLSLHDPLANQIDGLGSRLPLDYLNLLLAHQAMAWQADDTRKRARAVVSDSVSKLASSAAIDPVDGGFYRSRLALDWSLVAPWRDGLTQAQAIWTFATVGKLLGRADCVAVAERALKFQSSTFACDSGLVALVSPRAQLPKDRVYWNSDALKSALSPSAWECLSTRAAMRPRGNIPLESDPSQQYYRLNTLTPQLSVAEVAQRLQRSESEVAQQWQEAMDLVQRLRDEHLSAQPATLCPDFITNVSTISACLALHVATSSREPMQQAVLRWQQFEQHHAANGEWLLESARGEGNNRLLARAGDLAMLMRTLLDFYDCTLDSAWLKRAEQVLTLLENRLVDQRWSEQPNSQRVLAQTQLNGRMVFGESTLGVMKQNIERWRLLGQSLPTSIQRASAIRLPELVEFPQIHTDYLFGLLIEDDGLKLGVPADVLPATRDAVLRLPLRLVTRCSIPANGGNLVLWRGDQQVSATASVSLIESLLQP